MKISKIVKEDINYLEKLGSLSLPIYYKSEDILFLLKDPKYILFKVTKNNLLLGFCFIEIFNDRNHIMSICVNEKYRKLGIGTKIINYIKINFKKKISLYVQCINKIAVNFYLKNKFKIIKKIPDYYSILKYKEAYYMIL